MKRHWILITCAAMLLLTPKQWADEGDLASTLGIDSLDLVIVMEWGDNWEDPVDGDVVTSPELLRSLMRLLKSTPSESGNFPLIPINLDKRSLILKSGKTLKELRLIESYLYSPVDGSIISGNLQFEDSKTQRAYIENGKKYSNWIATSLRNRD